MKNSEQAGTRTQEAYPSIFFRFSYLGVFVLCTQDETNEAFFGLEERRSMSLTSEYNSLDDDHYVSCRQ